MMDLNKIIKNLSKEQKEELLKLLNTEEIDSSTDKVIYRPRCGSFHLVKNGKAKGHQRFIYTDCKAHFAEYKNIIFNLTKKNIQLWKSYIKMMFDGYTIKQIASDRSGSVNTANIGSIVKISDIIEENGVFKPYGKKMFDDYWMNYNKIIITTEDGKTKKLSKLQEFLRYKGLK